MLQATLLRWKMERDSVDVQLTFAVQVLTFEVYSDVLGKQLAHDGAQHGITPAGMYWFTG